MKQFYIFTLVLLSQFSFSQNFTDTKGELQISASGIATYTLPIATPPSIKGVAPSINLSYNSSQRGGIAGQGWSINNISTISRIGTRRDIDGFVDGVDFDDNDKLALDGQRLLIKTGTYWASGSTYETEYKSNTKIELKIEGTTIYFIVTAPDGSRSWYGSKGSGSLQNSVSLNAWYIVRYEDPNGNFIDYNYSTYYRKLYIESIIFSGNSTAGIAAQNKILFRYKFAQRIEQEYLKGVPVDAYSILSNIEVSSNNLVFRTYSLAHASDSQLGYERVVSIKELNSSGEESNPVVFKYAPSPVDQERKEKTYTNNLDFDKKDVSGDFDGDGRLDFAVNNQLFTKLFDGASGSTPITMPVYTSSETSFAAITLSNNKLNQFNSIVNAEPSLNSLTFKYYNLTGSSVNETYSKTVSIPNIVINSVQCVTGGGGGEEQSRGVVTSATYEYPEAVNLNNQYLEGDFNGDGISEVIIFQYQQIDHYGMDMPCTGPGGEAQNCNCILKSTSITNCANGAYYLNLNPNGSTVLDTKDFVFMPDFMFCKESENKYTADFNGDGKTDILIVDNTTKNYSIVSIRQLVASPWQAVEIIGTGNLDKYSKTKQILFGDYNGDRKTDIMLPDSEGGAGSVEWHIYYSNGNPAVTGFFTRESHNIVEYRPDTSKEIPNPFTTQIQYSSYFALDINSDGKTDLVRVWKKYYSPGVLDFKNHNTQWQVTGFVNNVGKVGSSAFIADYDSGVFDSGSPESPTTITSNYRYKGTDTDIVLVRGHYNKIEYYQFNKNVGTENRLIEVSESSGNVKHTIEYKSMEVVEGGLGNASSDFYSSENTLTYPNVDIRSDYKNYLVSKVISTVNGVSKFQDFRYRSYISNFNYGGVGFLRSTRSNWYLSSSDSKIWATQLNDANLRGLNTITWSSTEGSTVFNNIPSNLLVTKTNEFSVYTAGGNQPWNTYQNEITIIDPVTSNQNFIANNSITATSAVNDNLNVNYQSAQVILKEGFSVKGTSNSAFRAYPLVPEGTAPPSNTSVFNILLAKQTETDHLADTKVETAFTYDGTVQSTNYFGLKTKIVTKTFNGITLQGTTTVDAQYDNNPTGTGMNYYVGRPKKVNSSTNIYTGDTRTSEQLYTYIGSNLTKIEKKGTGTYAIVEDMTYDPLGNLLTKTVSAPAAPIPTAPRTVINEYDSSKRFVAKTIDHQKFISNFLYNAKGQLTQSTDPLGVVNIYTYDNWGKSLTTTTQNVSLTPLVTTNTYTKSSDGGYTIATTDNTDVKRVLQYDVLGRPVIASTKGFASGSMTYIQTVYDGLGKKTKESEPYFTSPSQWTEYEYDYLMRPIVIKSPTGKIQTLSYSGLKTESIDDGKTTSVTVDALGNKIQTTDPGGSVNFIYYADGQLKESNYQGNIIGVSIDGWGSKVGMSDPGAGSYAYSYDAFGQIKTETNLQNTTSFSYDDAGKPIEKTIIGAKTNSKTTYTYNALGQITSSIFLDNGKTITNTYEYDNLKRLYKTTENTPYAVFVKEFTYDTFGRVEKEISTGTASGKTSYNAIKNTYKNGYPWQILDDATQQVLWQTNSLNERGQLTGADLGNGISITNSYDQYGYTSQLKFDRMVTNPGNVMTFTTAFEPKRGNLNNRTNNLFNWNESFSYDGLDQLLKYNNAQGQQELQDYDLKGKITQNSFGTYNYTITGKTYQNNSITLSTQAMSYYQNRGVGSNSAPKLDLDISYNAFKRPFWIKEKGRDGNYIDYINFLYNDNNDRSTMFYGGSLEDLDSRPLRKYYSGDGTIEIKDNRTTGEVEFITYIGGDGYSAPVVFKKDNSSQNYLYLHRDYQGSILGITNASGAIVEKRLFDAWGSILKVQDGSGNVLSGLTVLDRGYTGHEHLQSVGLINMNARLYDPLLHRFLQVDNYIQDPSNTQNYNQYGYVLNNPLKYTDPSGNTASGPGNGTGSDVANSGYTAAAASTLQTLKDNWNDWRIKEWTTKNLNFNSIESGVNFLGQNLKSLGSNITSLFGKGSLNVAAPVDISNHVSLNQASLTGAPVSVNNFNSGDWYGPGGRINWAFGTAATMGVVKGSLNSEQMYAEGIRRGLSGNYQLTGRNLSMFREAPVTKATIPTSKVGQWAGTLGKVSFFGGVMMDGVGVWNYTQNPNSPNAVHPAKAGLNTIMGAIGTWGSPLAAMPSILYFGIDGFYPGGWIGLGTNQERLYRDNRAINPNYQAFPGAMKI